MHLSSQSTLEDWADQRDAYEAAAKRYEWARRTSSSVRRSLSADEIDETIIADSLKLADRRLQRARQTLALAKAQFCQGRTLDQALLIAPEDSTTRERPRRV